MSIAPEILFHRFFQTLHSPHREQYKGKEDLERLQWPDLRTLLMAIQTEFNDALRNERRDIPEHVGHPPFHFDYIESSTQNALAFCYEGFSFIALPLR
jgi:hypothetical protein